MLFLLSGLGRVFAPETMIALNELNNRYTHAVLLGIGALLVAVVLFFDQWKNKSKNCSA
ncbi:hypothetical protein [Endozoicomonas sp. Mp262]|uniref:hypothetical protein n=1 Tax=Endozoicomonas sp. Mp262 TaxID=2919499 RepID=UPI0021D92D36